MDCRSIPVKRLLNIARGAILAALMVAISIGMGALLSEHQRPLSASGVVAEAAGHPRALGQWQMTYVLSDHCECSAAVRAHLLLRGPLPGVDEHVYVVGARSGDSDADPLRLAGFPITFLDARQAGTELGVHGGPMLIIRDPSGRPCYAGGFGAVRPASDQPDSFYQERTILAALQAGIQTPDYPALGCSIGQSAGEIWADLLHPSINNAR